MAEKGEVRANELTVKNLFKRFLEWVKANRADGTYQFYNRYLMDFAKHHGTKKVTALMPRHVERWIETNYMNCSSTTRCDIMKGVARAINWGIQKRYIKLNPLVGMEKPSRKPREVVITQEQFTELLSYVPDQEFQDYLVFLWNTGCRAMEIRILEKRHVDGATITIPASEAKGKKHARVIYLNDTAKCIIDRLCKQHPKGPLFRTTAGKQWTANAVRCRFTRTNKPGKTKRGKERKPQGLAAKMGIPGLCATTIRHSWATNALKAGMDSTTASILMGHRDPATLIRNYQHLTKDSAYLLNALNSLPSVDIQPTVVA